MLVIREWKILWSEEGLIKLVHHSLVLGHYLGYADQGKSKVKIYKTSYKSFKVAG